MTGLRFRIRQGYVRPALLAVGLCCFAAAFGSTASAQITAQFLIGRSIEKAEPGQFADVDSAIALFQDGDVRGARDLLVKVRQQHQQLPPVEVIVAQLFFATNQVAAGRAELEQAVTRQPTDPEAYYLFAELARQERRLADAESIYLRSLGLADQLTGNDYRKTNLQIGSYAGLGSIAASRRNWTLADRYAQAWAALEPKSVAAHRQLGMMQFRLGAYQSSLQSFQKAFDINPSSPRPEIAMALMYEELVVEGDKTKRGSARNAMKLAVKNDPDSLTTRLAVARWALDACEIDMAAENVDAARKIDAGSLDGKILAGLVARHRQDAATAEKQLLAAHLQSPSSFVALMQLALVLIEQKDEAKRQRALGYAELCFRTHPDTSQPQGREAAITMAWVLFNLGQTAQARNLAESTVVIGSLGNESAYLAAEILHASGQTEAARQILVPVLANGRCFPTKKAAEKLLADTKSQ